MKFHNIQWTVEDWKDFYKTLKKFKNRVISRYERNRMGIIDKDKVIKEAKQNGK